MMERLQRGQGSGANPSSNSAGGNEVISLVAMLMKRDKQREKERKEEKRLEAEEKKRET